MVLGDSMDPAKRVVIHTAEQIPERMVDDADPERPWVKGKRRMAPAQTVDRYFKCSVLPAGSFEEAKATEVRAAAREARRNDPERRDAEQRRIRLARARQRWLHGYEVPPAELGLEELGR